MRYHDILILSGYLLIAIDAAGWLSWFSLSIQDLNENKLQTAEATFSALAAPHTAIIPCIFGIIWDLKENCKDGECKITTPSFTWFLFPFFVVPFDVIQYIYNSKIYKGDHFTQTMSIYSIVEFTTLSTRALRNWPSANIITSRWIGFSGMMS